MKWLDRAMFVTPYHYGLCLTVADFERTLRGLGLPVGEWPAFVSGGSNATTHFFVAERDGVRKRVAIVCLEGHVGRDPIEIAGVLVHEAVHIFQWTVRSLGERKPSKEFMAYGIQWLSQELMWAYREATCAK